LGPTNRAPGTAAAGARLKLGDRGRHRNCDELHRPRGPTKQKARVTSRGRRPTAGPGKGPSPGRGPARQGGPGRRWSCRDSRGRVTSPGPGCRDSSRTHRVPGRATTPRLSPPERCQRPPAPRTGSGAVAPTSAVRNGWHHLSTVTPARGTTITRCHGSRPPGHVPV
jgi:hypothetical protein